MKIWYCKIGEVEEATINHWRTMKRQPGQSADGDMRSAVGAAYLALAGEDPKFLFSGWGGELDESERAVVENREPDPYKLRDELRARLEPIERQIALIEGRDA